MGLRLVPAPALNPRAEPNTSWRVLLAIPKGGKVYTGDQIANGYRNVTYNGLNGWALNAYWSIEQTSCQALGVRR